MSNNKKKNRPIVITIPKRQVFDQTSIHDANKNRHIKKKKPMRKPSEVLLTDSNSPRAKDFKKDGLLLPFRLYAKKQDSINHQRRIGINPEEKYIIGKNEMRRRLYVENPYDDVHTVTDIDSSFFKYLKSHPPIPIVPLYKTLKFQYHEHLRTTQEVGYRRDCILIAEQNHNKILDKYEVSVQRFTEQEKLFEKYISMDYKTSIACLDKSAELAAKVIKKQCELEYLANVQFLIQSRLIGLNYLYFTQQKYGRFLYYISPPTWRSQHRDFARSIDIEAKGFDLGNSSEEETFNSIFKNMQNECVNGLMKPALYFSRPDTLMSFFIGMEKHELHQFTLAHLNASHIKLLTENLLLLKSSVENDSAFIAFIIEDFGNVIIFLNEKVDYLKARFFKILHGMFYDTVASIDVLKLQYHLDFCYEMVFLEKPVINLMTTAKALEKMYMEYSFKLESIKSDDIKEAMKESIENEKKTIKRALKAARVLRDFNRLERALLQTHKNVTDRVPLFETYRPLIRKFKRKAPESVVKVSIQPEITEAEFEYLTLFTDWTVKDDPAHYLYRLSN